MKKTILKTIFIIAIIFILVSFCACGEISNISLSDTDITLSVGDSRQIEVIPTPQNAVLKNLTWSSSDTNIVSVEDGLLKAKNKGAAVVKVETSNGISKACNVTVTDKGITEINLVPDTLSLEAGKSADIKATLSPKDASNESLSWSTDDKSIAIVNSSGTVTAISKGVTNITCSAESGVHASCTVTVSGGSSQDKTTIIYQYGHYNPSYTYKASDFVFPESSIRKLSESEVKSTLSSMTGGSVSNSYAQDAINEIYARNGYVFKNSTIASYYNSKPWYYADSSFTTSKFSDIENYNIKLLEKYA